jgi:5-methylcytosine-specific restriction endonuclease McrA
MSAKKVAGIPERRAIREAVFRRDGHCVALDKWPGHRCFGEQKETVHHLKKASQGGRYVEENLVWLCSGFNSFVEDAVGDDREALKRVGLVL